MNNEEQRRQREALYHKKKEIALQTDLCGLLTHLGYTVVPIGRYHSLKEHDSIRLYNRKTWSRFSDLTQGGNAIDWMIKMEGCTYNEAVDYLVAFNGYNINLETNQDWEAVPPTSRDMNARGGMPETRNKMPDIPDTSDNLAQPFQLPEKALYQSRLYAYLGRDRGISRSVIQYFENLGLIYIAKKYLNVVFVSKDASGIPRHAALRSTDQEKPFKGDAPGSNKRYGFNVYRNNSDTVVVTEAAIDLLSYVDVAMDFDSSLLSLGGTADNPLEQYLQDHPNIKHVKLLLDGDEPGSTAISRITEKYTSGEWAARGIIVQDIRPKQMWEWGCKDMNELLNSRQFHPEYSPGYFFDKSQQIKRQSHFLSTQNETGTDRQSVKSVRQNVVDVLPPRAEPGESIQDICIDALYKIYERMDSLTAQNCNDDAAWKEVVDAGGALYELAQKQGWEPLEYGQHTQREQCNVERLPSQVKTGARKCYR